MVFFRYLFLRDRLISYQDRTAFIFVNNMKIEKISLWCIIVFIQAVVAQLVEHVIGNDEVSGSIPDNGSRSETCRTGDSSTLWYTIPIG